MEDIGDLFALLILAIFFVPMLIDGIKSAWKD